MYLTTDVLKYTLPEEMIINKRNVAIHNLINDRINDFFDFGKEKIFDLDNSINSLVGCCSFGTGHLDSFIDIFKEILDYLHSSRKIQDHKIF